MSLDDCVELGGFDRVKVSGPKAVEDELSELERELIDRLGDPSPAGRRDWCRFAVENRVTMLISGGTSSGRTTFFNGLLRMSRSGSG